MAKAVPSDQGHVLFRTRAARRSATFSRMQLFAGGLESLLFSDDIQSIEVAWNESLEVTLPLNRGGVSPGAFSGESAADSSGS